MGVLKSPSFNSKLRHEPMDLRTSSGAHGSTLGATLENHPAAAQRPTLRNKPLIARLATETLTEIFSLSAPEDSEEGYDGAFAWIRLTHVCGFWRDILLENPLPWANHVCTLPPARDTFLDRAQQAPLTLRIRERDLLAGNPFDDDNRTRRDTFDEWLDFCITHLPRAKTLYLYLTEEFDLYPKVLSVLVNANLPYLKAVHTTCNELILGKYSEHCAMNPLTAPNLRQAMFRNAMVPWDPAALLHLTLLEEDDHGTWVNRGPVTFGSLLRLLHHSVNLRTLELHADIHPLDGMGTPLPVDSSPRLSLPNLHTLFLVGYTRNCTRFLTSMAPAPLTDVGVVVRAEEGRDANREAVGRLLASVGVHVRTGLRANGSPFQPTALYIRSGSYTAFAPAALPHGSLVFQLDVHDVHSTPTDDDPVSTCKRIVAELGLSPSTIESLDVANHFGPAEWSELNTLFPNVRLLRVDGGPSVPSPLAAGAHSSPWTRLSVVYDVWGENADDLVDMVRVFVGLGIGIEGLTIHWYDQLQNRPFKAALLAQVRDILPKLACS